MDTFSSFRKQMGLLVEGEALSSEDMKQYLNYIREHGINQFLCTWHRVKDIHDDELRFGDEIECGIFAVDSGKKTIQISTRSAELIDKEHLFAHESEGCTWHPEFGAWMIESTPSRPYTNYVSDLLRVERNMILRRRRLLSILAENEIAPTVTCFPLLGVGDFIHNAAPFAAPYSQSIYVPDSIINPHPRFAALVQNIRNRRGGKVDIRVPLYRDEFTPEFLRDLKGISSTDGHFEKGDDSGSEVLETGTDIHMDAMAFGMGMCCLQVTFQARDVDESRYMYDQLAVLAPIMLAMTAASPIFKGRLADIDARWTVIAQSVDDRTPAERGLLSPEEALAVADPRLVGSGIKRLPKSRYDSISTYIYHCKGEKACQRTFEIYNDVECPVDEEVKKRLRDDGVDENLAHHLAHLFSRDPIVAFHGQIEVDDTKTTDHFESIQSTNWQTCRWKPPPFHNSHEGKEAPHIGWRTEFRSMEVQLTDFENAAFTVFVALITRVVLAFDLAFYIPISKVDENMARAHKIEAASTQKFFFRKYMAPPDAVEGCSSTENSAGCIAAAAVEAGCNPLAAEDSFEEMTMDEIFNGKQSHFPGLIPLVYAYLDYIKCDSETYKRVEQYLTFIQKRAKGELITPATWMRRFVTSHPDYRKDSVITPAIAHDLMIACNAIGNGTRSCPELLGSIQIERVRKEDAYGQVLAGRLSNQERSELIKKLMQRAQVTKPDITARTKWRADSFYEDSSTPSESILSGIKIITGPGLSSGSKGGSSQPPSPMRTFK